MAVSRILIVDDDVDALDLFHMYLKREDREIVTYSVPEEAIAALKGENWDVVITDLMMPNTDGFTVVKEAFAKEAELPCIAITGFGSVQNVKKALEIGCFGYINKPFDWNYLNDLVDKAVICIQRYRRQAAT